MIDPAKREPGMHSLRGSLQPLSRVRSVLLHRFCFCSVRQNLGGHSVSKVNPLFVAIPRSRGEVRLGLGIRQWVFFQRLTKSSLCLSARYLYEQRCANRSAQ